MKFNNSMHVILDALQDNDPMTIPEICELTGLKYRSLYNTSPNMLEQLKEAEYVHVSEWRRAEGKGGKPKPVYAFGEGKNAPYPGKKPLEEKYAISRDYNRQRRLQKQLAKRSIVSVLLRNPFNRGKK